MADIEAHITGTVWKIEVAVGDEVSDGDTVVILESMKMEMPVEAEDDGVVKEIKCEEGQSVSEGDVLVVIVEERPSIAQVDITGVKEFDKDTIKKSLRDVGLGEARVFDRSLLERAEQELKRQYLARGLYSAQITSTVTPVERNRVNVAIAVDEGDAAHIKSIRFTGNKTFSDSELRDQIELTTEGWFTWYTKRDQYSRHSTAPREPTSARRSHAASTVHASARSGRPLAWHAETVVSRASSALRLRLPNITCWSVASVKPADPRPSVPASRCSASVSPSRVRSSRGVASGPMMRGYPSIRKRALGSQ